MRYLEVRLAGSFRDTGPLVPGIAPPSSPQTFRYDRFLETVQRVIRSRRIQRVCIRCEPSFTKSGYAGLQAVRRELERLRNSGTELEFFAMEYGAGELYLASVCDVRCIHPLGSFSLLGLASELLFFRKLLAESKIGIEVFRRGRYKSAADSLKHDRIDPLSKEQYDELQRQRWETISMRAAEALRQPIKNLESQTERGVISAAEAVEKGFCTALATPSELQAKRSAAKEKPAKALRLKGRYGRGKRIAVLCFEGAIIDGRSRRLPLMGQAVGDENFSAYIEKLRKNRRIAGVILRINSGGGSATASENIYQALQRLAMEKPLYASMGTVAASGGYWISLAAQRTFAESLTVTGSIGVIRILVNLRDMLRRFGITASTLKTHQSADFPSSLRKPNGDERRMLEEEMERIYQAFIDRTAESRKRPPSEITPLAEGRVWSGHDAVRLGLVDEVGGLPDAIEDLRRSLGIRSARVEFHPRIRRTFVQRLLSSSGSTSMVDGGARMGVDIGGSSADVTNFFARPMPIEPDMLVQTAVRELGRHLLYNPAALNGVNQDR
ncbi:MAG: signal peptide peptidase SppA [Spirochaetaceae bacterium]|nr:MAG: signal peptide peptidase SppA [Spirochaetaceae bacterium]